MARYDYLCPIGHLNESEYDIGTAPRIIMCTQTGRVEQLMEGVEIFCVEEAIRCLATNTSFMINHIMSPPSQRLKPAQIGL